MKASYYKHIFQFKRPSGTSRGVLHTKDSYYILIESEGKYGVGECGLLRGLSCDDLPDYEQRLAWACENIQLGEQKLWESLIDYPSIQFGIEIAFRSLQSENPFVLFDSAFTQGSEGIAINGLIWMGTAEFMREQIQEKLAAGFDCLKMKIGAIEWEKEREILAQIRAEFDENTLEIRVDANGSFDESNDLIVLSQLAELKIHSIEQPVQKKHTDRLSYLVKNTLVPIALDESLIGLKTRAEKAALLDQINPQYCIFKPSFIGGFRGTKEWIDLCEERQIGWWITSALEGSIGLNAIAQWTYSLGVSIPQGLGTGSLYTNNVDSPLQVANGKLWYRPNLPWADWRELVEVR